MANRHGLIAGATGTGKTVKLRVIGENFSRIGVPESIFGCILWSKVLLRSFEGQRFVDRIAADGVDGRDRLMGWNSAFLRVDGFPFPVFNFQY